MLKTEYLTKFWFYRWWTVCVDLSIFINLFYYGALIINNTCACVYYFHFIHLVIFQAEWKCIWARTRPQNSLDLIFNVMLQSSYLEKIPTSTIQPNNDLVMKSGILYYRIYKIPYVHMYIQIVYELLVLAVRSSKELKELWEF